MKTLVHFLIYMAIAVLVILMAIILGDYGAWYFAWLLGTVMLVLISAAGAALLDTQEEDKRRGQR
ncbi:hypothetical protein Thimo_0357 [Thioflavicoccus mobilis 8321]|uniref:Cyd operon protein YbgT n=1 Tax=Thioflavicoccus mobilis 8321 TaxID=765912 RepID=L0GT87_9GAMM|nr:hypothetical protein [Thioflavicoccus mobilis]AGA89226.1 hypothetical protein Thimo_0357 [Thioflavicoccus mobilis 8321]